MNSPIVVPKWIEPSRKEGFPIMRRFAAFFCLIPHLYRFLRGSSSV